MRRKEEEERGRRRNHNYNVGLAWACLETRELTCSQLQPHTLQGLAR